MPVSASSSAANGCATDDGVGGGAPGSLRRAGDGGGGEQVAGVREARVDVDGGEEAEVADLHEAVGKDVLEKAADEFDGRTRRALAPRVRKTTAAWSRWTRRLFEMATRWV